MAELGGDLDVQGENTLEGNGIIQSIVWSRLERYQLVNYDKVLLNSNKDMSVLLKIRSAFEESTQRLNESVKTLMELIKGKITDDFKEKKEIED